MAAPVVGRELETMETVMEALVVLPSAVMVAVGLVRGIWESPAAWRGAEVAPMGAARGMARRGLVLVHDNAREKLLRSSAGAGAARLGRAADGRIRLVYNGG